MKALLQRVSKASVHVDEKPVSQIGKGLLILLGIVEGDGNAEIGKLAKKCSELRIFEDGKGKMNLSIMDVKGEVLVVSQFTLAADCAKGRRPSFDRAAAPDRVKEQYRLFCVDLATYGIPVREGVFGAKMDVQLTNEGPVTIMLDTAEF